MRFRSWSLGITLRTALLSWLVTIATLLIFVSAIIPQQKRTFLENLESKAHGVAVSLRDEVTGAAINDDLSTVVDHCNELIRGDKTLDYLVVTKNDGFSLIHERNGWRPESNASKEWRPDKREPASGIGVVPMFHRRVFHYSQPFDYSGIQWGWIHVGLSLQSYDRSVSQVYYRTGLLAIVCIALSLLASVAYAQRIVRPILNLKTVVQDVASGDLSARAKVNRSDELGSLAASVNSMAESLLRRHQILQSVRFAAEQFLSTSDWQDIIGQVLANIGQAAQLGRIWVYQDCLESEGLSADRGGYMWSLNPARGAHNSGHPQRILWPTSELSAWESMARNGEMATVKTSAMAPSCRRFFEPLGLGVLALLPIKVEGSCWGFMCLGAEEPDRRWMEAEHDSFRAAADMLGAAIAKQRAQSALLEAKETLEQRVIERTKELQEQVAAKEKAHTELAEAQQRLIANSRDNEEQMKTILNSVKMGIMLVDARTHKIVEANTYAVEMLESPHSEVIGKLCHGFVCPAETGRCPITNLNQSVNSSERIMLKPDGTRVPILKSAVMINHRGQEHILESFLDITELKKAEGELKRLHQRLVETSRQVGMAEVATSVLHNVGNVLNSVNVSCALVLDRARQSEIVHLPQLAALFKSHDGNLTELLTQDPKGSHIPAYLRTLIPVLVEDHEFTMRELVSLRDKIDHIKEIVSMQQDYACISGAIDTLSITQLVEDAIKLNSGALERHNIRIVRQFDEVPQVTTDKHKVLQILLNLIRNAKYACDEGGCDPKFLTLRVYHSPPARIGIQVIDNGVGIRPENMTKIFSHGFTTRKGGHGFGLHGGALAAKELGGSLIAESAGPGQGATFTLELPCRTCQLQ